MVQQGVEQGAARDTAAGVDHQPGRLVDDDDVRIGVDHPQRDVLGGVCKTGDLLCRLDHQRLAAEQAVLAGARGAIDADPPLLDPGLQAVA